MVEDKKKLANNAILDIKYISRMNTKKVILSSLMVQMELLKKGFVADIVQVDPNNNTANSLTSNRLNPKDHFFFHARWPRK